MVHEVYDSLFFPHISRFPLRGSPAKRERVYGAEQGYDTLSFS